MVEYGEDKDGLVMTNFKNLGLTIKMREMGRSSFKGMKWGDFTAH